jgi:hypothetical protein
MIETLDDWNDKLEQCGCCFMPECPAPVVISQKKSGDAVPTGGSGSDALFPFVKPAGDPDDLVPTLYDDYDRLFVFVINGTYQTHECIDLGGGWSEEIFRELTYINDGLPGGSFTGTRTNYFHDTNPDPDTCVVSVTPVGSEAYGFPRTPIACPPATSTPTSATRYSECTENIIGTVITPQTCPGPFTASAWRAYSNRTRSRVTKWDLTDPITPDDLITAATVEMDAAAWTDGGSATALLNLTWPKISDHTWPVVTNGDASNFYIYWPEAEVQRVRFRFRIPDTHTGSYFKITYDIAEFPDDGAPSLVSEDNVIEWTGPGTGASSDPSWLTDWVVIEPPETSGERRIVNVRYTCYSGAKYGVKPQIMGEAYP